MRGDDDQQEVRYISPEKRVPADSCVAADPQGRGRDSEEMSPQFQNLPLQSPSSMQARMSL
jgi:hypothetical protein